MSVSQNSSYDVLIIGGGPGGSTTGTLLKKYHPDLRVLIVEREKFPREHVGESQLPQIGAILDEMGVWDKVEAANFPIKIGATYLWGQSAELWDFEFLPIAEFKDEPRPAQYRGQRRKTALQVERALYDDILLHHAEEHGCEVRQETAVVKVLCEKDRVTGVQLSDGTLVTARHYVDASGHGAILRRTLGVATDCPTNLKNIAIWDYWENAEWAVHIGVGGTRVQVMSVGFGWIWFIPLGPTRTSIGLVCPAEYYKKTQKPPEELYLQAVQNQSQIQKLIQNATRSGNVRTTNDWSFLADRTVGENWFLVGEAAGFADPILAAGLTLTHVGAREAAYTILALEKGEHAADWLKKHYNENQRRRIAQHIRFADFWYAANGQFTDLQAHCREIARTSGLNLTPQKAWAWLAQGGFTNDVLGQPAIGGLDLAGMKGVMQIITTEPVAWHASEFNVFRLNLAGAEAETLPYYDKGTIKAVQCYVREGLRLPMVGTFGLLTQILRQTSDIQTVVQQIMGVLQQHVAPELHQLYLQTAIQSLEVLVSEGWVTATLDPTRPRLQVSTPKEGGLIHAHKEGN